VGNKVVDNVSDDNWNTGIAIGDLSDGSAQDLNEVARNHVDRNGGHGIEITDANYIAIHDNIVSGNGTGVHSVQQGGYSGIHLYSPAASGPGAPHGLRCSHNVIQSNRVDRTQERPAALACSDGSGSGHCTDGNGIQVDRFCSFNDVSSNVITGNAGDGISIYGAANNRIVGNRAAGNNQQIGRTMFFPGPGEIAVHAINLPAGSASGNVVRDNVAITSVHKVPAFFESSNAGHNTIGPNNTWQWTKESEPSWFWGPVYIGSSWYSSAARVNQVTGTTGNAVGLPPP
jgi:parallel beta-helix repeat protein